MESQDLRNIGLKATTPRSKRPGLLENAKDRHPAGAGEKIGLAAVCRVLAQFEAAELVTRQRFEDELAVFGLERGTHHDPIVCVHYGWVGDCADDEIEKRQRANVDKGSFTLHDHSMTGKRYGPQCPGRNGEGW